MSKFVEYKEQVLNYFDSCIFFASNNGFENSAKEMRKNKSTVEENKLVILTCGEMKRGKSSLLSALIEDEGLFPVDVAVATCVVTMAYYGSKERITIVLDDGTEEGKKKEISRQEIQEYVTEGRNSNNHKKAKLLLIETPNPRLKNGLVFVDTPGVGSLNPEHSQVTYGFLSRADIVFFISDATSPLTEPELAFLTHVKKYCNNFIFVLTKKDLQSNFQDIIETNKDKIQQFCEIPKEKICYIPVSSTMKLAYLQNKNPRMLKSSNFEAFETSMWDMINKNRANIIINPPLAELALQLKSIEKDLHIKAIALNGSKEEQQSLQNRLKELQENRQKLLSSSGTWQQDIQYEISTISSHTNYMISKFQTEANDCLDAGLKNPQYIKNPSLLLNEVVLMASNYGATISEDIYNKLINIKHNFEDKTKLNLYENIVKAELDIDDDPNIVFQKPKVLDKAMVKGRKVSMNVMGLGAFGTMTGAILGGIGGFFLGGPVAALELGKAGAGLGAMLGSAVGGVRGTVQAIKDPNLEDVPKIRAIIAKYISQTVNDWKLNLPKYMTDISYKFIKSLKESIESSKNTIEKDIESLQNTSQLNAEQQLKEQRKLQKVNDEFSKLVITLSSLRTIKAEDDIAKPNTCKTGGLQEESSVHSSSSDFSHLEE